MDGDEKFKKLEDNDTVAVSPGAEITISNHSIDDTAAVKGAPPIVYKRRFFVLFSYIFGIFFYYISSGKNVILATSYAKYHNVTNEVSFPTLGIDFLGVIGGIFILFTYPIGGYVVDKVGLVSVIIGNFGLMLSQWIRYLAFTNFHVVLFGHLVGAGSLPMVACSILAISNRWFPENERAKATAAGAFVGLLGTAVGIALGSVFKKGPPIVDFTLLSCKKDKVPLAIADAYYNATAFNVSLPCLSQNADAHTYFCCYTPARIELFNLITALLCSFSFVFSLVSVRNLPPTPPAPAAEEKPKTPFKVGFKTVLSNRRLVQLSVADFFICGPPIVLYSSVARILPKEVSSYDLVMSIIGIAVAIPACIAVGYYLDKHHTYWTTTFGAYVTGTTLWLLASIGYSAGGLGGGVVVIVCGAMAASSYIVWQVSGFELKLEWGFKPELNVEGAITAFDRILLNMSSLIFVAVIPPERWGSIVTFWAGFGILLVGIFISALIPNKHHYNRLEYEKTVGEHDTKVRRPSVPMAGITAPIDPE